MLYSKDLTLKFPGLESHLLSLQVNEFWIQYNLARKVHSFLKNFVRNCAACSIFFSLFMQNWAA